jgi:hypothetical protein
VEGQLKGEGGLACRWVLGVGWTDLCGDELVDGTDRGHEAVQLPRPTHTQLLQPLWGHKEREDGVSGGYRLRGQVGCEGKWSCVTQ